MKIYTGYGDKGDTQIIGGEKRRKDDSRVEAYGSLDELNSFIGLAHAKLNSKETHFRDLKSDLHKIQHYIFDAGTSIADVQGKMKISITSESIDWLEKRIDFYNDELIQVNHFILPGGHEIAATLHICRTITRRSERQLIRFSSEEGHRLDQEVAIFINRLSDYFFTVARYVNQKMDIVEPQYTKVGEVFHHKDK